MNYTEPEEILKSQKWLFALDEAPISAEVGEALGRLPCHALKIGTGLVQIAISQDQYAKTGTMKLDPKYVSVAKAILVHHPKGQKLTLRQFICIYILRIAECRDNYHPDLPYPALVISMRNLTEKDHTLAWKDLWFACEDVDEILNQEK